MIGQTISGKWSTAITYVLLPAVFVMAGVITLERMLNYAKRPGPEASAMATIGDGIYAVSFRQLVAVSYKLEKATHRDRIPEEVQMFVWKRDGAKCIKCGSQEDLEFDHIIPLSKGGANTARNIQLLCEACKRS